MSNLKGIVDDDPEGVNSRSLTSRFRFLSWSEETSSIREFLKTFPLPRVVRITNYEEGNVHKNLIVPSDVDITQPLLLYRKYRQIKLQGKCLKLNKSGKWKEVGPNLVIPDSFPGWFSLVGQDGKECSMMLASLGQVAAARIPAFLTKHDITVFRLTESSETDGNSVYLRTVVRGGSVLRLLGVWADLGYNKEGCSAFPSQKSNSGLGSGSLGVIGGRLVSRNLSHNNAQPHQRFQYVQCLSQDNQVLFVPFSASGIFYPVAPRGGRNPQHVYLLAVIAKSHRLPIRVKMVAGKLPENIPDFTGTLEIEEADSCDVILACTLLKDKPSLFELDVDCDFLLSQMTSQDLFIKSTSYQSAINYCGNEGESWRRQVRKCSKRKGTLTGTVALRSKLNRTLRIRSSSPPPPSKLSLLFRPNSTSAFGNTKDPLIKRSKSFNVEVQSVSISLNQDEEDFGVSHPPIPADESTKRLSTLFNFISGNKQLKKENSKESQQCQRSRQNPYLTKPMSPDVLPSKRRTDIPYGRVLDEVADDDQNIYAEITDNFNGLQLSLNPLHNSRMINYQQNSSNMSSLLKGGGSDGAFSGTLSGTFSSSNPSSREGDIYDNIF